ncbi:TRAP transporter small permease [Rhodobacteraceae bacterium nBUS_24]
MYNLVSFIDHKLRMFLAILFAGLISVVAFQVIARNLLAISAPWSLECAQLLFSWCIFIGAGLAFRYGQHYTVDLWPPDSPFNILPKRITLLASGMVIFVLIRHGAAMSEIGLNRTSLALGISEFWFYLPIPISGILMALFLIENIMLGDMK